jgi:sugar lactone lactonase YvrE
MKRLLALSMVVAVLMLPPARATAGMPDDACHEDFGGRHHADSAVTGFLSPDEASVPEMPRADGRRARTCALCRHAPVTTAKPFAFIPADGSCCTRPEDGVGLDDGSIVVGDRDSGLRRIARDHRSSRPFGRLPADALVNGVSRDRRGFLIVTDIGQARVFEVDPRTGETRTLFASPVPAVLNDAVRTADGRVWVSLSTRAALLDAILQPRPDGAIWRVDPTGRLAGGRYAYDDARAVVAADRLMFANGLLLDDDETHLYWAETTGNVIMKARIGRHGRLAEAVVFAQIPFGGDNLAMDVQGNVYFANDWLTGVWAVDPAGVVFPILDFRWARTALLIRAWADATASAEDRLRLLEPDKHPPQFPRVPSTPFFVDGGRWLCLGTYETDLDPARFNRLPCLPAPVRGQMK